MKKFFVFLTKMIAEIVLAVFVAFLAVSCVGIGYVICTTDWSEMTLSQGSLTGFTYIFLGAVSGYFCWLLAKAMKKVWQAEDYMELFE